MVMDHLDQALHSLSVLVLRLRLASVWKIHCSVAVVLLAWSASVIRLASVLS